MFGIGLPEMILILALALIVVGPDKLPDLARSIAKTIMDLKKTAEGLKDTIHIEDNPLSEIKPELEDAAKKFKETILDAETHTWKDPSPRQDLDDGPINQSSTDALSTIQPASETIEEYHAESDTKDVPKATDDTQDSNSSDPDKHV